MSAAAQQKYPAHDSQPPIAAPKVLPDDWYLLPYESAARLSRHGLWLLVANPGWRKITAAFAVSALLGLGAAAVYNGGHNQPSPTVAIESNPVPVSHPSQDELDQLETRNRRLEALIKVLRQRQQNHRRAHDTHVRSAAP